MPAGDVTSSDAQPPRRRLRLRFRLHVALAIITLRLLGAYLRIAFALCAAAYLPIYLRRKRKADSCGRTSK
jgi:hypothetical protein